MPRVYIGNLASSVTSRALHEHFSRAGGVISALESVTKFPVFVEVLVS